MQTAIAKRTAHPWLFWTAVLAVVLLLAAFASVTRAIVQDSSSATVDMNHQSLKDWTHFPCVLVTKIIDPCAQLPLRLGRQGFSPNRHRSLYNALSSMRVVQLGAHPRTFSWDIHFLISQTKPPS